MRLALFASLGLAGLLVPLLSGGEGSLADDARVGVVTDRQGTLLVRPQGRDRWTPIGPRGVLLPGDLVRTPVRGANAAAIRLAGGGGLVLGPGAQVELVERGSVRLLGGELEASGPLRLTAPGGFEAAVKRTIIVRCRDRRTERIEQPPRWLTGYRASTTDEWMGSLVANVDGRNVPLSIGYHKVNVDIRDQIARTTVEQSFVNSTKSRLEGVFYFPLPADASISGFGMWIGGELVEADIVEKQRARAIYEDILRRKKDPGLLEWSGGNLFKARVFPIEPHSEKRIRIRYTQALPLEGSWLRYRYALRSELLRSRPLRELRLNVRVSSSMRIRAVASPTHEILARHTPHAASAAFSASEYSPQRDFELAVELDRGAPLSVIPHRRGEDGYFMLLLLPPGASQGKWKRELVPEQGPIDLLLIADTSGSMDGAARAAQAAFVDGLLNLLGAKDRFRLMACDVDVAWFRQEAVAPDEEQIGAALEFLRGRSSLGWTDLDRAFATAAPVVSESTLVVYVGDGIGTTGDADPVALAQRLRRHSKGVFHAVSASSTYEQGVLEAIASIGGGSVRPAGSDPARAAYQLLAEAAQPAVKNLKLRFEGLRTARVYPETLPNLAAGTQQVVLGRFLPVAGEQRGRVTVSGTLDGKPVSYSADLVLKQDESGNSFVPRLWARRHIDALLAQGRSAQIQQEIVAFSEEMGIMTPYTSFLVLESDEDRERYGVARRVKMRDGERFFAEGRDRAATQLLQQQMQAARAWRLRLRARALREIATLGTHLQHAALAWQEDSEVPLFAGQAEEDTGVDLRGLGRFFGDEGVAEESDLVDEEYEAQVEEARDSNEVDRDGDDDFEEGAPPEALDGPYSPSGPAAGTAATAFRYLRSGWNAQTEFRPPWIGRPLHFSEFRFPHLPGPPAPPEEQALPRWPDDVISLLRGLDRRAALSALPGGVQLRQTGGAVHALRGHRLSRQSAHGLYGAAGWYLRRGHDASEPIDQWLVQGTRGALSVGVRLGRRRDAKPADRGAWNFPLHDYSLTDLVRNYATFTVQGPASREAGIDTIVLKAPGSAGTRYVIELEIETARGVLVSWSSFNKGKRTASARYSGFVRVAGMWWARKVTQLDGEGRTVARYDLTVKSLDAKQYARALQRAVADHDDVIFVGAADPALGTAKQAAHEKKAGFAERFRIALHFAASQQWERVWQSWKASEAAVKEKPGANWLRAALMRLARKGKELKAELLERAREVAASSGPATDFLAERVIELGSGTHQPQELLGLLKALRPAFFRRGEDEAWRQRRYRRHRANWLESAGQPDQALELWRLMAVARPFDARTVTDYARALRNGARRKEAGRVLERALTEQKWLDQESGQLYAAWTDVLWEQRLIDKLLEVCEAWIRHVPRSESGYQRRLATLLFLGREKEADGWVAKQLRSAVDPERTAPLRAAISFALGHGWNYWTNRLEEKWERPLRDLVRRLIWSTDGWQHTSPIVHNDRFRQTDAHAELVRSVRDHLSAEGALESMEVNQLNFVLQWLHWGRNQVDEAGWRRIADRVKARWAGAAPQAIERQTLARLVLHLLDQHGEQQDAIAFLRTLIKEAARWERPEVARQLRDRLATQEWSQAIENEILSLLPLLLDEDPSPEWNRALVARGVRWAAERLFAMRYAALLGPARQHEKLPRGELKLRRRRARAAARKGLAARFATARDGADERARPWFELERLCFAARLGEDLEAIDGATRELLFKSKDWLLRERCAYVLEYAATRRKAPQGLDDALLATLAELDQKDSEEVSWKGHRFRLLVALDRPGPLAELLEEWVTPAQVESRWRIARGYLLAEQGRLEEAIAAFEAVAATDELRRAEYRALASWYLASGSEQKHEEVLLARYEVMQEWRIARRIWNEHQRLQRRGGGVPKDLDRDLLRAMRVLLAKSSRPASHIHLVRSLYLLEKDFRLLECLPYGVIGHTPQGIYAFLQHVERIVREVHEQATCDQLVLRIRQNLERHRQVPDRRGLLLLTVLAERRASEVLNAPGPHVERGLAALKAALPGSWSTGERPLMASFLASLGKIPDKTFAAEQLRQLAELHAMEGLGTIDRLQIALFEARTHWKYRQQDRAIDILSAALEEYLKGREGLSEEAHEAFGALIDWLSERSHFARAEALIRRQLAAGRSGWLARRLFKLYVRTLDKRGSVSIGRGTVLYRAARALMEKSMWNDPPAQVKQVLVHFCALHRAAQKRAGVRDAWEELERFAYKRFPELVTRAPLDAPTMISQLATTIRELRSWRAGLAFLIARLEVEPAWYGRTGNGGWSRFGSTIAKWRYRAGDIGPLEPRLLKLVLAELHRDLTTMRSHNWSIYRRHNRYFWQAKMDAFTAAAQRVIELYPDSPARQLYAARYLWNGLKRHDLAINVLAAAEQRKKLREEGRHTLVEWLHQRKRYADSLPLLDRLLAQRPERIEYAVLKIRALHRVRRGPEALALLAASEKLARETNRWNEKVIARLAATGKWCGFFGRAVGYYEEVILLHQRTHRNRGVGQGMLSDYYGELALSYAGLGRSDKAVDAASAAVVSWGPTHRDRARTIEALQRVIEGMAKLDDYVARRDAQVEKSGLDAPLIRKTLGRVYLGRKQAEKAIPQLLAARDLQPGDEQTHAALLAAYDMLGQKAEACAALVATIRAGPMNLKLYTELGRRLAERGDDRGAERAWTTLVEVKPNEAQSHRMLAQQRERQKRHADAVEQWRQVVRIRTGERPGWLSLAKAQILAGDRQGARAALQRLLQLEWEPRFKAIHAEALRLLQSLEK